MKKKKMTPEERAAWEAEGERIQKDLRDRMKRIELELAGRRKDAV
jgi:hypothetical protein